MTYHTSRTIYVTIYIYTYGYSNYPSHTHIPNPVYFISIQLEMLITPLALWDAFWQIECKHVSRKCLASILTHVLLSVNNKFVLTIALKTICISDSLHFCKGVRLCRVLSCLFICFVNKDQWLLHYTWQDCCNRYSPEKNIKILRSVAHLTVSLWLHWSNVQTHVIHISRAACWRFLTAPALPHAEIQQPVSLNQDC